MAYTTNANGEMAMLTRTTLGLAANYFNGVTINTTGTAVLAANASRQLGVWLRCDTASAIALVGDVLGTAVMGIGGGTAALLNQQFIPGTGAIYVKASSGFVNVSGCWI